ncbi:HU family DNA-binding protein [Enterococcus sp. MJM12]|uniref:DNA-binding protein HU n=2 Tax=Enterococcus TaxID=1350 RepID=A0ABS3H774_9ENTE|nr:MULTISPECIES: HU family DNA-binding protein [Enterococcus]MBO0449311.1 HU family DNA-binding protein [Enterococcus sp. MJM12]MDT2739013.1 HU family DNA-binding protein [Enterococcus canintestini]WHA09605.1 HU family DNA-binding protein [Enterococcus montenegrensis]
MNKADLISAVAEKSGVTKKDATAVLAAIIDTVETTLKSEESVQIMGFGTFETRKRAARKGRNPQTGEEIEIPASVTPAFKPGKQLKDAVK